MNCVNTIVYILLVSSRANLRFVLVSIYLSKCESELLVSSGTLATSCLRAAGGLNSGPCLLPLLREVPLMDRFSREISCLPQAARRLHRTTDKLA